jgi:hypothetical protein
MQWGAKSVSQLWAVYRHATAAVTSDCLGRPANKHPDPPPAGRVHDSSPSTRSTASMAASTLTKTSRAKAVGRTRSRVRDSKEELPTRRNRLWR